MATQSRRLVHEVFVVPWRVYLAVIVPIVVIGGSLILTSRAESASMWSGAVLQVLGLGTIALGLREVRQLFERPGAWELVRAWGQRVAAAVRPRHHVLVGAPGAVTITGSGTGRVRGKPGPNASVEQRLHALERDVEQLYQEVDQSRNRFQQDITRLRERAGDERQERIDVQTATDQKLEAVAVGGLYLEMVGLTWLFLGVILGTLPGQVGQVLRGVLGVG